MTGTLFRPLPPGGYAYIFRCMAPPKLKVWSRDYRRCVRCKRTQYPHWARGLCRTCYVYEHSVKPARARAKKARKSARRRTSS